MRIVSRPRYLEVGSWAGSTACSAMDGNVVTALCIDNWSQFGGPKEEFFANVDRVKTDRIIFQFIESDFRAVQVSDIGRFNIYLFDGPHGYQDQYDSLTLYKPALDDDLFFVVDDWNWGIVRSATKAPASNTAAVSACWTPRHQTPGTRVNKLRHGPNPSR